MDDTVLISRKVFMRAVFFIALNLMILDGLLVYQMLKGNSPEVKNTVPTEQTTVRTSSTPLPITYCPRACINEIIEATTSAQNTSKVNSVSASKNKTQEYYVPLGTGTSTAKDWTDVVGAQAYVDSNHYSGIKKVTFDALVRVPNANEDVYVRLYNVTDKHPVWNSELFFPSGTTSNFLIADSIQLDEGNKLYQVQMKTQLQAPANLDQSRIHITAE